MKSIQITGPVTTNILVPELKVHARISDDEQGINLEPMIQAAVQQLEETECGIQLLSATYELQLDAFPESGKVVEIPRPPFATLVSIKYVDTDGNLQTLADNSVSPAVTSDVYTLDTGAAKPISPAKLYLAYGKSWPSTRNEPNAVRIRYTCGFGTKGTNIPEALRIWLLIVAGTIYEHREKETVGAGIPGEFKYVDGLLDPWRVKRFAA